MPTVQACAWRAHHRETEGNRRERVGHHDAVIGIEHQMPSTRQLPKPVHHDVVGRAETLRERCRPGNSAGVGERLVHSKAQVLNDHHTILAGSAWTGRLARVDYSGWKIAIVLPSGSLNHAERPMPAVVTM
ncbi:MAG: hypothetical protein JWR52_2522 [Marmoricola sp.]|nr:hypothetical protein [Marmoricola sp.]